MRLVFNDLVTEVQRSIGYFQGIDRKAKIGGVVVLGNAVKLPGLQQYLAKNLGYEVNNFEAFSHLKGSSVLAAPAFKDNQLSFGVCYGLCLQGLGVAKLHTNLVPREIMTERLVRSKKPWAVASVAALVVGLYVQRLLPLWLRMPVLASSRNRQKCSLSFLLSWMVPTAGSVRRR